MQRLLPLLLVSLSISTAAFAQFSEPQISLDGRIVFAQDQLAQNSQAPNPGYYRPVAPQGQQVPCGGFSTPPCTGQMVTPTGPTAEQLFIAAKQADANHQPEQSINYLTRSAQMGYRKAQYALGIDYQKGNGVPQDAQKAKYWFDLAAQQGSTSAQQAIGTMDPAQAIHYLQMGAEQRDAQSEFDLAMDYELGHGIQHDRSKAIDYFRRASRDGGHSDGEQIAAALAKSSAARRFQSQQAVMALVPVAPVSPKHRTYAGCPDWVDSNHEGTASNVVSWSRSFCIAHPNCSFTYSSSDPYVCNGDETPLKLHIY
jgi:TPR repeat protein